MNPAAGCTNNSPPSSNTQRESTNSHQEVEQNEQHTRCLKCKCRVHTFSTPLPTELGVWLPSGVFSHCPNLSCMETRRKTWGASASHQTRKPEDCQLHGTPVNTSHTPNPVKVSHPPFSLYFHPHLYLQLTLNFFLHHQPQSLSLTQPRFSPNPHP